MTLLNFENESWWKYLDSDLQNLLKESFVLLDKVQSWDQKFHDYAFIVFPAAKAYEGFLKNLFFEMKFITGEDYFGKRFRIGKALNPSLDKEFREREGVYDRLVGYCGNKTLPNEIWETWKDCRNVIFHWFPNELNAISYQEAEMRIKTVVSTMKHAYSDIKASNGKAGQK